MVMHYHVKFQQFKHVNIPICESLTIIFYSFASCGLQRLATSVNFDDFLMIHYAIIMSLVVVQLNYLCRILESFCI